MKRIVLKDDKGAAYFDSNDATVFEDGYVILVNQSKWGADGEIKTRIIYLNPDEAINLAKEILETQK